METKAIVLAALNAAITSFKERGGKVYSGDIVIDYNPDNVGVASFIERHPGWVKLYVTLQEGTGLFFLKCESSAWGNTYFLAWEEDNFHVIPWTAAYPTYKTLYGKENNVAVYKLLSAELERIISKGLSICR